MTRNAQAEFDIPEGTEMVVPSTGMIIGQRAAAQAVGWSRPTIVARIKQGILHPQIAQGGGRNYCFSVEELAHHARDGKLNPIPVKRYLPDAPVHTPRDEHERGQAQAVEAASDPHRQTPPIRRTHDDPAALAEALPEAPAGAVEDLEAADIVLTQTVTGTDSVVRETMAHIGDLESAFEYTIQNPGRYAVKRVDSETGVPVLLREIDTTESSMPGGPASPDSRIVNPPRPGYSYPQPETTEPPGMLPVPAAPAETPADRMMNLLLSFFLKQASDVSSQMNPAQTAAQLIEMWESGRSTGTEAVDALAGPGPGDTNGWDFLVTLIEHVGPNVGEQLGNLLALAMMRAGNNGDEPERQGHAADVGRTDSPAAARLAQGHGAAAGGGHAP